MLNTNNCTAIRLATVRVIFVHCFSNDTAQRILCFGSRAALNNQPIFVEAKFKKITAYWT